MGTTVSQMAIGMKSLHRLVETNLYAILKVFALACFTSLLSNIGHADGYHLAPHTKLQLSILQWCPSKGEYLKWDATGGSCFRQKLRDLMTH